MEGQIRFGVEGKKKYRLPELAYSSTLNFCLLSIHVHVTFPADCVYIFLLWILLVGVSRLRYQLEVWKIVKIWYEIFFYHANPLFVHSVFGSLPVKMCLQFARELCRKLIEIDPNYSDYSLIKLINWILMEIKIIWKLKKHKAPENRFN